MTLKATFHHTPETVRRAFALIAAKKIRPTDYITGEAPLSRLQQVLRHMLNRDGDIKTAIIPGPLSSCADVASWRTAAYGLLSS